MCTFGLDVTPIVGALVVKEEEVEVVVSEGASVGGIPLKVGGVVAVVGVARMVKKLATIFEDLVLEIALIVARFSHTVVVGSFAASDEVFVIGVEGKHDFCL